MLYSKTPAEFYKEIEGFAEQELRAARAAIESELARPASEREQRGRCVRQLRFLKTTSSGCFRFVCRDNFSDLREGDIVIVHPGDPFQNKQILQWVADGFLADGSEFIDLAGLTGASDHSFSTGDSYMVDGYFLDLSASIRQAIQQLGASERGRDRILPLLMGQVQDDVDIDAWHDAFDKAGNERFNERQQEAIASGVSCSWCTLIQGPPGTGKTRVLANIAKQRLALGQRILVTACTHRAIHEALNAIRQAMPECDTLAKISQRVHAGSVSVPVYESFAEAPFSRSDGAYLIGATPFAARNKRLSGVEFDCILMDEASQMTLPLAIMAMLSADTYVIIGDPRQLPPVVQSVSPFQAVQYSLFSQVSLPHDRVRLNVTYRMNETLTDWVSEQFYSGELCSAPSSRERRLLLDGDSESAWLEQVLSPDHSLVWIPTATSNTRRYSLEEADLVHRILGELFRRGFPLREVAVITPFRRQARVIRRRLLQSEKLAREAVAEVVIDTVDRMQGQERTMVILSTAASDTGYIRALREFLYLPQRINVAVSRARVKCIVLGSESFANPGDVTEDIREAVAHWSDLMERCEIVNV